MNGSNRVLFQLFYFSVIVLYWSLCPAQPAIVYTTASLKPEEKCYLKMHSTRSTPVETTTAAATFHDPTELLNRDESLLNNSTDLKSNDLNELGLTKTTLTNETRVNAEETTRSDLTTTTAAELSTDDAQYYINDEEAETDRFSSGYAKWRPSTSSPDADADYTEDYIEMKINEAIDSITKKIHKLPELVLSDNKTHFKFHKNSKEMIMDEKITEIAKQQAEKSLRNQYEKQKLGAEHFNLRKFKRPEKLLYAYKSLKSKKLEFPDYKYHQATSSGSTSIANDTSRSTRSDLKSVSAAEQPTQSTATEASLKLPNGSDQYESASNLPLILGMNRSEDRVKEIFKMLKPKKKFEISTAN